MRVLQCRHCLKTTLSSPVAARVMGWRMFDGVSVTGKPISDVVCPSCAGTATMPAPTGWVLRCNTCDWTSDEDDDDEPIASGADALYLARDHECAPDVDVLEPGADWRPVSAFNRDGTLRRPA